MRSCADPAASTRTATGSGYDSECADGTADGTAEGVESPGDYGVGVAVAVGPDVVCGVVLGGGGLRQVGDGASVLDRYGRPVEWFASTRIKCVSRRGTD